LGFRQRPERKLKPQVPNGEILDGAMHQLLDQLLMLLSTSDQSSLGFAIVHKQPRCVSKQLLQLSNNHQITDRGFGEDYHIIGVYGQALYVGAVSDWRKQPSLRSSTHKDRDHFHRQHKELGG
jgi:hypothetical protein